MKGANGIGPGTSLAKTVDVIDVKRIVPPARIIGTWGYDQAQAGIMISGGTVLQTSAFTARRVSVSPLCFGEGLLGGCHDLLKLVPTGWFFAFLAF